MPSAGTAGRPDPDSPLPYAFERIQRDSDGGEVARLEAQNLLLEKLAPLDQLPPTPAAGSILDLGSGTGFWSARLAARVPQGRIICLDRSLELLDLARQRLLAAGAPRAEFLHQDLRCLQLPDRAFDLVFTSVTLAHVQELEGVLARIADAMKPGGWIACFEPIQQSHRFCAIHPPCSNLDFLMDRLLEVVEERGSDLSVALKIAHHLDRMGLEEVTLRNFGTALHGEDAVTTVQEIFLPLARAYLRHRWEPELLERRIEAGSREACLPHLWMDFRRAVVLARKSL
jgi:SAM-dependent methyltransferase